jgi:eukaryotic-like serine/threonine-protein kinase
MEELVGGCPPAEVIQGFAGGTLDPAEADRIEQHVDDCEVCRALVAALVRSDTGVDIGQDEAASAPTAVDLGAAARAPLRSTGHPAVGTQIDRYVIERPLGAGGMGAVSLADDPELRRKVCLKLLRPELLDPKDTQGTRVRLLREAQAMAQISHPNVVAVFDIGTYEGQVFIAMEYIEGSDLAAWLRRGPRRPAQVIDVFLAAGRGLAAAHRAGLVHRDFKPQNVMIGADGSVKVTDFGLARADREVEPVREVPARRRSASGADSLLDSPLTRTGALVGTPAYMAPEQVRGDAIDARCDQFAFAVALYEGLFGERPFAGDTLNEIFAAASLARIRPMQRRPGVGRRVKAAILRGLRPAAADRFPTIDAFLAEIAPRPARRIAAAAIALVALAGGGAALGIQRWQDRRASVCDGGADLAAAVWGDQARRRVQEGFAATGLKLAAATSAQVARELDAYASEWVSAHREACVATRVREEQTEEVMALRMGCLERRRAELAAAVELLEHPDAALIDAAYGLPARLSAVADCADADGLATAVPLPRDPALRDQIAALRALLARAKVLLEVQRLDQARASTSSVLEQAVKIGWTPLVAEARLATAQIDLHQARHAEAEKGYHAAAQAAEQGGHDKVRGEAYLGLIEVSQIGGRLDEALRWAEYARATIERIGSQPALLGHLAFLLGDVQADRGDSRSAVGEYQRAVALLVKSDGPRSHQVAWAIFRLGQYYFRLREFEKAMAEFERALVVWTELGGADHPLAILVVQTMSDARLQQGRAEDALGLAERALAGYRRVYGDDHENTAGSYNSLGMAQQAVGRTDEGIATQERAVETYRRVLGRDHLYVASHLGTLAVTLSKAGRLDPAIAHMKEAIEIALRQGPDTADVITYRNALGAMLTRAKRYDEAITQLDAALKSASTTLAADAPQLADTLTRLGTTYQRKGDAAAALPVLERALEVRRAGAAGPWESSWTKLELAKALWDARGDPARAIALAEESRAEAEAAGDAEQLEAARTWLAAHEAPPIRPH